MSALLTAGGWMIVGVAAWMLVVAGYAAYSQPTRRDGFYALVLMVLALAVAFLLGLNWSAWTGGGR